MNSALVSVPAAEAACTRYLVLPTVLVPKVNGIENCPREPAVTCWSVDHPDDV